MAHGLSSEGVVCRRARVGLQPTPHNEGSTGAAVAAAVGLLVGCVLLSAGCSVLDGGGDERTAIRPSELPQALAGGVHVLMAGTCGGADEVLRTLPLEDYVALCVACEGSVATRRNAAGGLEFTWSDEALQFQGVLCRSYAAYHIQTGEKRRAMANRGLGSCAHLTGGEASQVVGEIEGDRVVCLRHVTRMDNARAPRSPGTVGGMLQPLAAILAPTAGMIAVRGAGQPYPTEYYSGAPGSWTNPRIDHTKLALWFPKQGPSPDFETVLREQYRKSDLTLARVGSDDATGSSTLDSPRFAAAQSTDTSPASQPGDTTVFENSPGATESALLAAQVAWEAAREAAATAVARGETYATAVRETAGEVRTAAEQKWAKAQQLAAGYGLTIGAYRERLNQQFVALRETFTGGASELEPTGKECFNPLCSDQYGLVIADPRTGANASCFSECSTRMTGGTGYGYAASYGSNFFASSWDYREAPYAAGTDWAYNRIEQEAQLAQLAQTPLPSTTAAATAVRCERTTETCNGLDDDCDGQIDEAADVRQFEGLPCLVESAPGACRAGTTVCAGGELHCQPRPASLELCDGFDNDCNGTIDDVAGGCTTTTACTPKGEQCNGQDDDCDGFPDNGNPGGGAACTLDAGGWGTLLCAEGQHRCVALALAPTSAPPSGANPLAGVSGGDQAGAVLACGLGTGASPRGGAPVLVLALLAVARLRLRRRRLALAAPR